MVDRQQEDLHGFWRAHIPSVESIFQELEDPGIIDLDNQVQKPISDRQKKSKWIAETGSVYQTLFVNDPEVTSHLLFLHLNGCKCVSEGLKVSPK